MQTWPNSFESYKIKGQLGRSEGTGGRVYSGEYNNQQIAIKEVDLDQTSNMEDILREIQVMSVCQHPNVITYHIVFLEGSKIYIVMPLMAQSLSSVLKQNGPIQNEEVLATILKSVLEAIAYLHDNHQIHRDVKCANILLDKDGKPYLSDFGVAGKIKIGKAKTFVGSPCWIAPEVLGEIGYDYKADIWSFGITGIELIKGEPPYADLPPMKVLLNTLNKDPPQLGKNELGSSDFKDLINRCLQKDPNKRPSAESLLKHKFFKKARNEEVIRSNIQIQQIIETISQKEANQLEIVGSWDFSVEKSGVKNNEFANLGENEEENQEVDKKFLELSNSGV